MSQVEGYEFIRELGRGAMGTVYLARETALDREVAVKRLTGAAAGPGVQAEARLLARLNHQHIVRVYELLTADQDVLMVMEYVPGTDLRRLLAERRLPAPVALDYVEQLAAALDHAHEQGVVHHDVKPANAMVKPEGVLKLGDFGVAELRSRHRRRVEDAPPPLVGTPEYMAPEVVLQDPAADHRADVYSLAVVAYELLAGQLPFPPDPREPRSTMRAQVEAAPPRPGLAEPVDAALLRGLEKRPDLRPRSAGELAAALRSAFEEAGGGGATLASWFPRQDGAALARTIAPSAGRTAPGAPGEGPHVAPPARRPRRRIAPLVVAVVVVAALALAAAALVRGRQTASPPAPARLQVASISATVEPAGGTGHCPEADFTFRGTVTTNGAAGTIRYRWLQPDGLTSAPQSVTVAAGARQATVTLVFKFSGNGSTRGLAALHVTSPIDASSPPVDVTYSCP